MYHEIYEKKEDGTFVLVSKVELQEPTIEEVIADKEAQLLAMYEELKSLKGE